MSNTLAPIVLFVYNRLEHTQKTVEALKNNVLASDSEIFIYCDGAKNPESQQKVDKVREFIHSIDGFKEINIIERKKNYGLANSVVEGVTNILNKYGKVIVLEDDLITSPSFLSFMNEALDKYSGNADVYSITGYSFTEAHHNLNDSYFLPITSSWGWATWADKWKVFNRDNTFLKQVADNSDFNFGNSYGYRLMAERQINNEINSWAIYWYASVLAQKGLTLYPSQSLVQNIGFDNSGTHCATMDDAELSYFEYRLPASVVSMKQHSDLVQKILRERNKQSFFTRCKNALKKYLPAGVKKYLTFIYIRTKVLFFNKKIGKNSYVDKTVTMLGIEHIRIGENTLISEQTWLNVNKRIPGFDHIIIGDYCYLGRRNLVSSAKKVIIGDYVMTNNECKFLSSNHIFSDPLSPYISTGTTDDGVQKIGHNVWIGAGTIVLGNVEIGYGSIVGAGSVVTKNIPPFSIAVGNPCKVIKRYNFSIKEWVNVLDYHNGLDNLLPSESDYLVLLKNNAGELKMPMMAATSKYRNSL